MKSPIPSTPADAPAGTVTLGGPLDWFSASLHVSSENLIPQEISHLLGVEATALQTTGVPILREDGSVKRIPKFGRWSLKITPTDTDEWNIQEVIIELLNRLPQDIKIWNEVTKLGFIQLSFGLSHPVGISASFTLFPELFRMLSERQIAVWFDVYNDDPA